MVAAAIKFASPFLRCEENTPFSRKGRVIGVFALALPTSIVHYCIVPEIAHSRTIPPNNQIESKIINVTKNIYKNQSPFLKIFKALGINCIYDSIGL
jgi:hypothetical protein